jgi:hypothetical protein
VKSFIFLNICLIIMVICLKIYLLLLVIFLNICLILMVKFYNFFFPPNGHIFQKNVTCFQYTYFSKNGICSQFK